MNSITKGRPEDTNKSWEEYVITLKAVTVVEEVLKNNQAIAVSNKFKQKVTPVVLRQVSKKTGY